MDGVPVFNLVRETMPAVARRRASAASSTPPANFILSALERGSEFDDALAEMQARGIAEADPSLDIDGWDAAAKTAALVNVLMGGAITPHHVARTGIRDVTGRRRARRRSAADKRIRLVASASRQGGKRRGPRRAGAARSRRSAGRARRSRERAVPHHRPARRSRHRAARRQPDADGLRAAERPVAHQPQRLRDWTI